jgi:hypothetical protein
VYATVTKIDQEKLRISEHNLGDGALPPATFVRNFNCVQDGVIVIVGRMRRNGSDSGKGNIFFCQWLPVVVVVVVAYLVTTPSPESICDDNDCFHPSTISLHLYSRFFLHPNDRPFFTRKPQAQPQSNQDQQTYNSLASSLHSEWEDPPIRVSAE